MQHIELKAKLQTISGNAVAFHLLSLPKEKYLYIVYEVVCLCYIPSRQCFEEMRFFKEMQFSLQSVHFNPKVVVIYKLVVALSQSNVFFSGRNIFVKVGFILRTICVICDVYCVLKCNIPVFPFLNNGNIPSGRCCFLQRLNT